MKFDHPARHKHGLWHRHVVALMRDAMPEVVGAPVSDADLRDYERGLDVPVFSLATRIGQAPNLREALREAQAKQSNDRFPLAIVSDERWGMEVAVLPFESFRLLVAAWWAATQAESPAEPAIAPPRPPEAQERG